MTFINRAFDSIIKRDYGFNFTGTALLIPGLSLKLRDEKIGVLFQKIKQESETNTSEYGYQKASGIALFASTGKNEGQELRKIVYLHTFFSTIQMVAFGALAYYRNILFAIPFAVAAYEAITSLNIPTINIKDKTATITGGNHTVSLPFNDKEENERWLERESKTANLFQKIKHALIEGDYGFNLVGIALLVPGLSLKLRDEKIGAIFQKIKKKNETDDHSMGYKTAVGIRHFAENSKAESQDLKKIAKFHTLFPMIQMVAFGALAYYMHFVFTVPVAIAAYEAVTSLHIPTITINGTNATITGGDRSVELSFQCRDPYDESSLKRAIKDTNFFQKLTKPFRAPPFIVSKETKSWTKRSLFRSMVYQDYGLNLTGAALFVPVLSLRLRNEKISLIFHEIKKKNNSRPIKEYEYHYQHEIRYFATGSTDERKQIDRITAFHTLFPAIQVVAFGALYCYVHALFAIPVLLAAYEGITSLNIPNIRVTNNTAYISRGGESIELDFTVETENYGNRPKELNEALEESNRLKYLTKQFHKLF